MKKNKDILVFVGTYSEDILFGNGEVLHGKGEGIYIFRLNPKTGELTLLGKGFGKPNPSYLTLDPTKKKRAIFNLQTLIRQLKWVLN